MQVKITLPAFDIAFGASGGILFYLIMTFYFAKILKYWSKQQA